MTRLVRTIALVVVVVAFASALSGYLLHGRHQSAAGSPADSTSPLPATPAPTPTPTNTATGPASGPVSPSATPSTTPATTTSVERASVPAKGNGRFTPVAVPETTTAKTGRVVTYSLQVEGGMHADTAAVATAFGRALLDRRGWQGVDHVRFVQIAPRQLAKGAKPQLKVLVASPTEVNRLCAPLPTHGDTSCDTSAHVVLNYKLWMKGVVYFKGRLGTYREYMVNHEVGHALGHGHQLCSGKGAYAPVMQQQTLGLHGCKAWPWPQRPSAASKA